MLCYISIFLRLHATCILIRYVHFQCVYMYIYMYILYLMNQFSEWVALQPTFGGCIGAVQLFLVVFKSVHQWICFVFGDVSETSKSPKQIPSKIPSQIRPAKKSAKRLRVVGKASLKCWSMHSSWTPTNTGYGSSFTKTFHKTFQRSIMNFCWGIMNQV